MFKWVRKVLRQCEESIDPGILESVDRGLPESDSDSLTLEKALENFKPDFTPRQLRMFDTDLKKLILYGVILGDISGSRYEGVQLPVHENYETIDLFTPHHRFTDDTALTIAVYKAAQKIQEDGIEDEQLIIDVYATYLRAYTRKYENLSYGGGYLEWALSDTDERGVSYGNGSCMRVGGIAVLFDKLDDVIKHAYYSAVSTHSHREGLKGAVCAAVIYWMLSYGATKNDIIRYVEKMYPNNGQYAIHCHTQMSDLIEMNQTNPWSTLTLICQTSIPEAVAHFLECDSFESCLRNSYKYLCDRDTISAIAGPMAAIFYRDLVVDTRQGENLIFKYLDHKLLADIN